MNILESLTEKNNMIEHKRIDIALGETNKDVLLFLICLQWKSELLLATFTGKVGEYEFAIAAY